MRICPLHDNVRPHTANLTKQRSDSFGWDVLTAPRILATWRFKTTTLRFHFHEAAHGWKTIRDGRGGEGVGQQTDEEGGGAESYQRSDHLYGVHYSDRVEK